MGEGRGVELGRQIQQQLKDPAFESRLGEKFQRNSHTFLLLQIIVDGDLVAISTRCPLSLSLSFSLLANKARQELHEAWAGFIRL